MIILLTDDEIINAADRGSKWFMSKPFRTRWIGEGQDVIQEGRLLAIDFMRRFDNPKRLNPAIISRRVYFGLFDLVRSRSKFRTLCPAPRFFTNIDFEYVCETVETQYTADWRDILESLSEILTFKEAVTLELFKNGFSQAQIARELGVSRSCVLKRFINIRKKLLSVCDGVRV